MLLSMTPLLPVMTLKRQHYTGRKQPAKSYTTQPVLYGTARHLLGVDVDFLTPKGPGRNMLCTSHALLARPSAVLPGKAASWYVSCL
jgi:hypothetical protein